MNNAMEHITSKDVYDYVNENNLRSHNISEYALFMIFLGMGTKTIDGRHLCNSIFEENDYLGSAKNEVTFDEAQTAIKALESVANSGLVEPYIVRKLGAVIASLKAASFNKTAISVVSE